MEEIPSIYEKTIQRSRLNYRKAAVQRMGPTSQRREELRRFKPGEIHLLKQTDT